MRGTEIFFGEEIISKGGINLRREKLFGKALLCLSFLMVLAAVSVLPSLAVSDIPDMSSAKAVYLYNVEQNKVMAQKDADMQVYPASTVKIMTGIVAIENLSGRLSETITVTEKMLTGVVGNNIKLKVGEKVTVLDMLYGTLCGGANDCASVLAHTVSGGIEPFVELMNQKAALLGALDTHYTNVSGMHDSAMVTTAYDTFLIAKAALETPLLVEITSESRYQMPKTNLSEDRNVYNKNYLISRYSETKYYNRYAKGLNSGFTSQGGYCLATCTEKNSQTYICVVMGADEKDDNIFSYSIANDLIDWAYSSYGYLEVLSSDRLVCEVAVDLSEDVDYVTLRPANSLTLFLPLDIDVEKDLVYSHKVTSPKIEAPVSEGQVAGFITVEYDGEVLGSVDLIAMNSVERSEFLYALKRIRDFTTTRGFIATVITFVILLVVYVFGMAIYRSRPANRRRRRR